MVTLTPSFNAATTNLSWSGACSGSGPCVVTITSATSVTATFTLKTWQLSVSVSGSGAVTSSVGGISCGATCSASYNHGQLVTLSRASGIGSNFSGWSGACSGTGPCSVTMDQVRMVGANFIPATRLAFTVQPSNATAGTSIAPAIQVSVQDAQGNTVTNFSPSITLSIATNPGSGVLAGTTSLAAVNGVATFSTVSINRPGVGYKLAASSPGLTSATSSAFNVASGPPARLVILGTPLTQPALACSSVRVVELQDSNGNPTSSAGTTSLNPYTASPASAVASFYSDAACSVASSAPAIPNGASQASFYFSAQNATAPLTLTASAGTLISGTQDATITQASPAQLAFTTAAASVEAGFCQPLTLERRDSLGRSTSPGSPTQVSLAASPSAGIQLYLDTACTSALPPAFDIVSGTSSVTVYAKGISGSLTGTAPSTQVYSLTASATGLSSAMLEVTVAPLVRRRSSPCALAANTATVTCPISPPLADISRTMLFFQATPGATDDSASADNVSCRLDPNAGVAQVLCERAGPGGAVPIEWQTVSFPYPYASGGVTVEHLTGGCAINTPNTMPIDVPVTNAPPAESFVLFSTRSLGATNGGQDLYQSRLTSSTSLRVLQNDPSTTCLTTMGFAAQVVSWAAATVSRGVVGGGASSTFSVSQATGAGAPTFLLYSSRHDPAEVNGGINPCARRLRGNIPSTTTLTFERGCTPTNVLDISWELVQLPTGASVQTSIAAISANASATTAPITAVDLTRSFAFIGGSGPGGQATGRSDYASTDRIGTTLARAVFASSTQLTFIRATVSGNGSWTGYVVQLSP